MHSTRGRRWMLGAVAAAVALGVPAAGSAEPTTHLVFPAVGTCIDGGRLTVGVRPLRNDHWVRLTVWIDGRRVKVVTGKRLRKPVTLTGLDAPVVVLSLGAASYKGRYDGALRTYRACPATPPD